MNAYFQLEMTPEGTNLMIHKETEGGAPLDLNELADYLNKKGIEFIIADLSKKISLIQNVGRINLDKTKRYPEREMINIKVTQDKMQAICRDCR